MLQSLAMTTILEARYRRSSLTVCPMKLLGWSLSTGMAGVFLSGTLRNSLIQTRVDRFKSLSLGSAASPPTPHLANASFPLGNFSSVAGKYDNLGYEPVELCPVSPKDPNASPSCQSLAANISTILPGATLPDIPTFFAKLDSPTLSHLRVTHFDGPVFNVGALSSLVSRCLIGWFLTFSPRQPTSNVSDPYWTFGLDLINTVQAFVDNWLSGLRLTGIWVRRTNLRPWGIQHENGQKFGLTKFNCFL